MEWHSEADSPLTRARAIVVYSIKVGSYRVDHKQSVLKGLEVLFGLIPEMRTSRPYVRSWRSQRLPLSSLEN